MSVERKVPEIIEGEERQDWLIIEAEFDERFNEKVNEILKRYMGLYEKAKKLNIEIEPTPHPNIVFIRCSR
ncbi:hypothetical protein [Pyrococcus kukulkanii]|uniref:hypothetical protein n=1 Tax=Pyrococcus kukulkanii TaxID=1609559 RepID=UPI003565FCDA